MSDDTASTGSGAGFFDGFTLKDIYGGFVDVAVAKQQAKQVGSNAGPTTGNVGTPPYAPAPTVNSSPNQDGFDLPPWAKWLLIGSVALLAVAVGAKALR